MSMQSHFYMDHLPDLVAKGEVPIALVDASVRRVLELKARLGLFDNPYRRIQPGREEQRVRTPDHLKVARQAAQRSIVLLKNEDRSEEHTSELQSLMRISYAVFCLKKKTLNKQ